VVIASLDLALVGGVEARMAFTGRGGDEVSRYGAANLGSHVGDDPDAVVMARSRFAQALGLAPSALTFMHPDHGRGVAVVTDPTGAQPGSELRDVDALVTRRHGVGLVALAADCVPIVLVEPEAAIVGVVHSGWKGVELDVAGAALDEFVLLGGNVERVRAWLGPAICGACYPVPAERVDQVAQVCPEAAATASDGQPALDLRAGLTAALGRHGVADVTRVGGCTREDLGLYSHRRDGVTGRHGAAVVLVRTNLGEVA
jgi:YfiH family protein